MPDNAADLNLTIVVTIVSGKEAARRCLKKICPQIDFDESEIIVPFDEWSKDIGELAAEFPEVKFYFIKDAGFCGSAKVSARAHRLYDKRRAVGLGLSRGRIIAMTEDHAIPVENWCERILSAHEKKHTVIGGAIENAIDKPLNWAWYYLDFGRYGRPIAVAEVEYVSDVNVSYKRETLFQVRDVWNEAYHETSVHWALRERGEKLVLDENIVVYQSRPPLSLSDVLSERIEWGRVFAETRAEKLSLGRRLIFAAGTLFLPPLLLLRMYRNMRRQKRSIRQMAGALPLGSILLAGWSHGEFLGYLYGAPKPEKHKIPAARESNKITAGGFTR